MIAKPLMKKRYSDTKYFAQGNDDFRRIGSNLLNSVGASQSIAQRFVFKSADAFAMIVALANRGKFRSGVIEDRSLRCIEPARLRFAS